jgi:hypothetical protein
MKFRYYIFSSDDGCIYGTDDTKKAFDLAKAEEYWVVDTDTGLWLQPDGTSDDITEL